MTQERVNQLIPRICHARRACIRHQRDVSLFQRFPYLPHYPSPAVLMIAFDRRRDLVPRQQFPRYPRILAVHNRNALEGFQSAQRNILQISNGGRHDRKLATTPTWLVWWLAPVLSGVEGLHELHSSRFDTKVNKW